MKSITSSTTMKKDFYRTRSIIKTIGWRGILATISAFSCSIAVYKIINLFIEEYIALSFVVLVIAALGFHYNNVAQANGEDIKNALMKDWCDLSVPKHLILILFSGISIYFIKYILPVLYSFIKHEPVHFDDNLIAYDR